MAMKKPKLKDEKRQWFRTTVTLTADGHEPFTHASLSTAEDWKGAAEFAAQTWLLGHPERRAAKNISVVLDSQEPVEAPI